MKALQLAIIAFLIVSCNTKEKTCTLSGKIDTDEDTLLLFKASKFPIAEAEIPISDSTFSFQFSFIHPEAYELVLKKQFESGSMTINTFFSEKGTVNFDLLIKGDALTNKIEGTELNQELNEYNKRLSTLFWDEIMKYNDSISHYIDEFGTQLSEAAIALQLKLRNATSDSIKNQLYNEQRFLKNSGKLFVPEVNRYREIQDSLLIEKKRWEFNYIEKNTTILSYYKFLMNIKETAKSCCWQPVDIELTNKAHDNLARFSKEFPGHPYNTIIQNKLNGLLSVHEGGRFIDFKSKDVDGNEISISEIVKKNRLTVLDFWSIWCSPCLKTSEELKSIYEIYNTKGLEIIGITQNYGVSDNIESFVNEQNYPWRTIIDEEAGLGLWDKYNISNQAGGVFMINASGKIIGVNLTASMVEDLIKENL